MFESILALIVAHSASKAVDPTVLAGVIYTISNAYAVDPVLVTKIMLVESKGVQWAYNKRGPDYGLMQLNWRTLRAYNVPRAHRFTVEHNIEVGVQYLAQLMQRKDFKPCMYNLGPTGAKKHPKSCLTYTRKLDSIK